MEIDLSFWKNKKVFITGHTGFKGSWLSLWLSQIGANVVGVSLDSVTSPSLFDIANVKYRVESNAGNILNLELMKSLIKKHKPEIIFHLAAQSLVKESYIEPVDTFLTNVMGTVNVLEAARNLECVKVIVNVTSDKCYENNEIPFWGYRENEPMGGNDPYSASKGCAELVTKSYRNSFFNDESEIQLASVRAGNVIGGGDWANNRLIPDVLRSIESGSSIRIRNPEAIRPWQHVLEPLNGYLLLAEKLYLNKNIYDEAWNFGPKDEGIVSVKSILKLLETYWGKELSIEYLKRSNFREANFLKLDSSKAIYKLNWKQKFTIDETIKWTASWYRNYLDGMNMEEYTLNQIQEYMNL